MRSLRMEPRLERRLEEAAAMRGETVSEFIRQAIAERADATLGPGHDLPWADVVGIFRSSDPVAERVHEVFGELVVAEHERKRTRDAH